MKNEVKVLKLTTGEEIITRMTEGENGTLILDRPMVVQEVGDASGRMSIIFRLWSFAGKIDKVTLESKYVLVTLESTPEMEKNYLSSITGISL
jgi:hypothetical protein